MPDDLSQPAVAAADDTAPQEPKGGLDNEPKVEPAEEVVAEPLVEPEPTEEEAITLEGVEQDAAGNFILKIDPDDPESSVYKGATMDELLANWRKGTVEKDKTIRQLKVKQATRVPPPEGQGEEIEVQFPDTNEVYRDIFRKMGVDIAMLGWTKEQWQEHEISDGAVNTFDLKQSMREAQHQADAQITRMNADAINDQMLNEETSEVEALIQETGIDPDNFDYEKVLDAIYNDPKYWQKNGIRRTGCIVRESAREIIRLQRESLKESVNQEIAEGKIAKAKAPGPGAAGVKLTQRPHTPADTREATALALQDYLRKYPPKK